MGKQANRVGCGGGRLREDVSSSFTIAMLYSEASSSKLQPRPTSESSLLLLGSVDKQALAKRHMWSGMPYPWQGSCSGGRFF